MSNTERERLLDRERGRRYRERHPERVKENARKRTAKWARENRDAYLEAQRKRRAKIRSQLPEKLYEWIAEKEDVFWQKVGQREADECWPWLGTYTSQGYGRFNIKTGVWRPASRIAWILTNGPMPKGLFALHHCDNPACCNPAHLYAGTQAENVRDREERGRSVRRSGHKLTEDQAEAIKADARTHEAIANDYGVSRSFVTMIKNGTRWKRVG